MFQPSLVLLNKKSSHLERFGELQAAKITGFLSKTPAEKRTQFKYSGESGHFIPLGWNRLPACCARPLAGRNYGSL
jgi:hypothetical protein